MEELSKYTPTQILKMINDSKDSHEKLKREIIDDTYIFDDLEKKIKELEININKKINTLHTIEKNYVALIEELNNRDNGIRQTDISNQ